MKVAVVRGAFLNQFEMQNFALMAKKHQLTAFSSLKPINDQVGFPVIKLLSPMDLLSIIPIHQGKRIARGFLNRTFIDAHYLLELEKKLQGFDIVHCAETYYHFTQQCLNAKKKGFVKKVVSTVWENIAFNNEGIWGRKKFKRRAIEEIDHFIAVSQGAYKSLISEGCQKEKITIIPVGIDLEKFKAQSEKLKVKDKDRQIIILFVGRLEKEKGIKELLETFKQSTIINQQPASTRPLVGRVEATIKLRIIGDGSLKNWIKEWIVKNQQESNVVIEQHSYQEMPQIYQEADIFILPSKKTKTWQEQFGMVLIEAMASFLPIIATRSGAIPEVVGDCGILVDEASVGQLSQALKRLVKDKFLRTKLGKIGRARAEKYFDSQKIAKKIEKVYENLSCCFN
ncbi:glycosyltransferase family 4 protein [Candidatus Microgenomates bacterium]|nr:glycosyltransferase family 4 protein [Candidatus Microgenomates bacterium]